MGNGTKIGFWHDVLLDNCPLKIRFHRLFRISRQLEWSMAEMHGVEWELDFRRNLGPEEVIELEEMMDILELVQMHDIEDIVTLHGHWSLQVNSQADHYTD